MFVQDLEVLHNTRVVVEKGISLTWEIGKQRNETSKIFSTILSTWKFQDSCDKQGGSQKGEED